MLCVCICVYVYIRVCVCVCEREFEAHIAVKGLDFLRIRNVGQAVVRCSPKNPATNTVSRYVLAVVLCCCHFFPNGSSDGADDGGVCDFLSHSVDCSVSLLPITLVGGNAVVAGV